MQRVRRNRGTPPRSSKLAALASRSACRSAPSPSRQEPARGRLRLHKETESRVSQLLQHPRAHYSAVYSVLYMEQRDRCPYGKLT
eukprot:6204094-Pleurochrysis_carterae.AAC.1